MQNTVFRFNVKKKKKKMIGIVWIIKSVCSIPDGVGHINMDISYSKQPYIPLKIIFTFFCWEALCVQHLVCKLVLQRGTD